MSNHFNAIKTEKKFFFCGFKFYLSAKCIESIDCAYGIQIAHNLPSDFPNINSSSSRRRKKNQQKLLFRWCVLLVFSVSFSFIFVRSFCSSSDNFNAIVLFSCSLVHVIVVVGVCGDHRFALKAKQTSERLQKWTSETEKSEHKLNGQWCCERVCRFFFRPQKIKKKTRKEILKNSTLPLWLYLEFGWTEMWSAGGHCCYYRCCCCCSCSSCCHRHGCCCWCWNNNNNNKEKQQAISPIKITIYQLKQQQLIIKY